jgi:uracil phosphoribosyltransferase
MQVDPMLELLPDATVHHIGMYRSKAAILPVQYYNRLPKEHSCDGTENANFGIIF